LTHTNFVVNSYNVKHWMDMTPTDVILSVAPLFHITGFVMHMTTSLLVPAPLVLVYRFHPAVVAKLIERYKVTFMTGAITMYTAMLYDPDVLKYDLSSFRKAYSGGAPIAPAIVDEFYNKFKILLRPAYGLTESTAPSHLTPLSKRAPVNPSNGYLAVGIPVFGSISKIVDEQKKEVPIGETGEIAIKGPFITAGYWKLPHETKHAIDDQGYFYTGDIGVQDKDGWFYVIDRKKDLIIASGYKVWPKEVEDYILYHPAVKEVAVVGVPDKYRGETVKAYVSLKPNLAKKPTPQELIEFCKQKMSAYKYPRIIEIIDEIPKNLSGKILRRELRAAL